jgi:aspartate/methionine/tyrosine aminotransferase
MINKMIDAFQNIEGGLFSKVAKADVGDSAARMQSEGVTLMAWADPFYPSPSIPEHVIKATIASIESGCSSHYTAPIGSGELKEEIAKKLKRVNGLTVEPQRNILITPGSDSGLFYAMLPFIEKGDEVMIVDPSYPNNFQNTQILGGKIVRIPVYAQNGYQLDIGEFEKRVTSKTKMVVLTNPNNPTSTVYRRECLMKLSRFIIEHDLVLVVDQAFETPVFDGIEMVTAAAIEGMWERTITVFSLSKGMGLSGFRVGYIVADDKIMDKLYAAAVSVLGAANTAAQIGAIAALRDDSFVKRYNDIHLKRRDMVYDILHDIPGVRMLKSESGFLSWLDVSDLGESEEIVDYLVREAKVAINIGTQYGEQGRGHVRIVHGVLGDDRELENALTRMREALVKLGRTKGLKAVNTEQYSIYR